MQQRTSVSRLSGAMTRDPGAAASIDWRRALWLALLVAATVGFSLGFACAMPFAALGAAAALTLPRQDALLLVGSAWLANQLVGFTLLAYPWTADTFVWGVVLGIISLLATLASQMLVRRLDGRGAVVVSLASFLGAFAVYEAALYVVSATMLGGTEDFAAAIVIRIVEINAAAFAGLLVLDRLAVAGGRAHRLSAKELHA
jgi:hypothetical protein